MNFTLPDHLSQTQSNFCRAHGTSHSYHHFLTGRYMRFTTRMADRPGSLREFLDVLTAERVNIVDMFHHRDGTDLGVKDTAVDITVETKDHAHGEHVLERIRSSGYPAERMSLN